MPATTHPSPASESGEPFVSLYRRFRPTKLSEIRGQPHVVQALRGAVAEGRVAHAYLFSGPRGTGKTSAARALAKALNCTRPEAGEPCGSCSSCLAIANGTSLDVRALDALHRRRGPHAVQRGGQRAPQDLGGTPAPRGLRTGHHRSPESATHRAEPDPALRVPAARR